MINNFEDLFGWKLRLRENEKLNSLIFQVENNPKAWFPLGDTFLEMEIKTITTFIPSR